MMRCVTLPMCKNYSGGVKIHDKHSACHAFSASFLVSLSVSLLLVFRSIPAFIFSSAIAFCRYAVAFSYSAEAFVRRVTAHFGLSSILSNQNLIPCSMVVASRRSPLPHCLFPIATTITLTNNLIKMKRNLLKTILVAVGMATGTTGVWAATGDITTNVNIDFSNAIGEDNVVAGTVGSMVIGPNATYPTEINDDGILVLGNGTHTVTLSDEELAGTRDIVKVSFELGLGKLSGRYVGFSLVGSDGQAIGSFSFCPYNGDFAANTFGVEAADMYYGYNTVIWDRKVSFTITLDYLKKTITTHTVCYKSGTGKAATEATHVVDMTNTNPLKTFNVTSNYQNQGRRCQFDNLVITTEEGDYSVASYVDVILKAKCGEKELSSTTIAENVPEGESVTYGFAKYILNEGTLYEAQKNSKAYYVGTTTASSSPIVVEYTEVSTVGTPVYFADFGTTVSADLTSASYLRASGGATVAEKSLELVPANTLSDGVYTFEIGNYKNRNTKVMVGENEIGTLALGSNSGVYVTTRLDNVAVLGGVAVTAALGTSSLTDEIDYILVTRTGEAVKTVSVTSAGLATYCPSVALDFSSASNVAAYKAVVNDDNASVTLTKLDYVAAGEGVLLRSLTNGATEENIPVASGIEKNAGNAFVGTDTDLTIYETSEDGTTTNYVLSKEGDVVGFFKAAKQENGGTQVGAGKAYLPVSTTAAAKGITFTFNGETTGISEIAADVKAAGNDAYYTISGVRVQNPTKGMYIKNGKKVVVK